MPSSRRSLRLLAAVSAVLASTFISASPAAAVDPVPLAITTGALPSGLYGVCGLGYGYSVNLAATGGTAPYTWALDAGTLPYGLYLNPAGSITGVPRRTGSAAVTLRVTDAAAASVTKSLTLQVLSDPQHASVSTSVSPSLVASGQTYSISTRVSQGCGPFTSQSTSSSASGVVVQTAPSVSSETQMYVSGCVKDALERTYCSSAPVTITPFTVTPAAFTGPVVNVAFSVAFAASGGTAPYTWSLDTFNGQLSTLPAGLTLSSSGVLAGTPSVAGSFTLRLKVRDAAGKVATRTISSSVAPAAPSIVTASLPSASTGAAYSAQIATAGGTGTGSWKVSSGALPPGLSLGWGGVISGTPTATGSYAFTLSWFDDQGRTTTKNLTLAVAAGPLSVLTSTLRQGTLNTAYQVLLAASGGTPSAVPGTNPYSWQVTSGSLPTGLSLSTSGVLSGTPTALMTSTFTVGVTDAAGTSASRELSMTVAPKVLVISYAEVPAGTRGSAYTTTLTASGVTGSLTWSVAAGSLPAGLTLAPSGTISGTPTVSGTTGVTVRATDTSGSTATRTFGINIGEPVSVTSRTLPSAFVGTNYSATLSTAGGIGPFTWTSTAALPAGLALSRYGTVSGKPTTAGTFTLNLRTTDAEGRIATTAVTIAVSTPAALAVTTSTLPSATRGVAYTAQLAATGGSAPYQWSMASGALPSGFSLSSSGSIRGTASATGRFSFTVRVTDDYGRTVTRALTLTVL